MRGAAGAHGSQLERQTDPERSSASVGILAWHPSPRAGDTRRGILALLLRDCNLCGNWNRGTGTWGLEPVGLEPNSVCSAPGLYTLRERGSPVPSRALNSPLSVVKCRGGWSCELQALASVLLQVVQEGTIRNIREQSGRSRANPEQSGTMLARLREGVELATALRSKDVSTRLNARATLVSSSSDSVSPTAIATIQQLIRPKLYRKRTTWQARVLLP